MQGYFLTENERERQRRFPEAIPPRDVSDYFTLSETDHGRVKQQRGPHNQLGFALQLCALRYLGFVPDELTTAPAAVVTYVAEQIQGASDSLAVYGQGAHTRTDHLQEVMEYAEFRKVTPTDWHRLHTWLMERALEHDKPTLLLQLNQNTWDWHTRICGSPVQDTGEPTLVGARSASPHMHQGNKLTMS